MSNSFPSTQPAPVEQLSNYQLHQKVNELLPQVKARYGLEFEVENDFVFYKSINGKICYGYNDPHYIEKKDIICLAIESDQIRQILIGLKEVLGGNPEYASLYYHANNPSAKREFRELQLLSKIMDLTPVKQSEALCQKWLDGLDPLFDTDPILVLTELVEILENLLK